MEQNNQNLPHNTSDEQYETNESSPTREAAPRPCRLSWFLVRNDPEFVDRFGRYYMVHAMDLTDPEYANAFVNGSVTYNIGKETITGKVIAVADNIELLKRSMNEWLEADRKRMPLFKSNVLVQYRPSPDRLVHKVMHESEVVPMSSSEIPNVSSMDIFVHEGKKLCQGMVLTRNDDPDTLINELTKVNENIWERIRTTFLPTMDLEKDATTTPKDNPWLLVQYSNSVCDCVYTIMRYDDTTKIETNAYPGLVVYPKFENIIYQALIVHKSCDPDEVIGAVNNIANSSLVALYPHLNVSMYRNPELAKYECADIYTKGCVESIDIFDEDVKKCKEVNEIIKKEAEAINRIIIQMDQTEIQAGNLLQKTKIINERKIIGTFQL